METLIIINTISIWVVFIGYLMVRFLKLPNVEIRNTGTHIEVYKWKNSVGEIPNYGVSIFSFKWKLW